jgi:VWFA-related protein
MRIETIAWTALLSMVAATGVLAQNENVFVTLVRTHFTVTDRTGHFVTGLTPVDFTIYEDDVPQRITKFTTTVRAPLSVALIIDRSRSVGDRFQAVSDAAAAFLRSVIRDPGDRGLVVAFDSKVYLLHGWTPEAAPLVASIHTLTSAGGTSLFDSLYKTCRDAFDLADTRQRIAVLVTDGEDTTSRATFEQALQMATLSKVVVYVVGIRAESSMNARELQGRHVLTSLADLTGGRVFYPEGERSVQLASVFARLQDELRNEYDVAYYRETPPDPSFHRIRVEANVRGLTVHAPTGYFGRRLP